MAEENLEPAISEEELIQYIYIDTHVHSPGQSREFPSIRRLHAAFSTNLYATYLTACSMWILVRSITPSSLTTDNTRPSKEMANALAKLMLRNFLSNEIGMQPAQNLLRQCTVLLWSALEILCSDGFVKLLNAVPSKVDTLTSSDRTKKLYPVKEFILEPLQQHKYDVSRKMGSILLSYRRMDNIETIRTVYDVLFPTRKELSAGLNNPDLYQLYMRRNLIVHRAAEIDEHFLNKTGFKGKVGDTLVITAQGFEKTFNLVADVGAEVLRAIQSEMPPPKGLETLAYPQNEKAPK